MESGGEVLVTGGCGSVGSAVVSHLIEVEGVGEVHIYDSDESSLVATERQVRDAYPGLEFTLGDVRDRDRLVAAMQGVDRVVHTAGIKHVPHCESHPYEAIKTNADGTWNVLQAAKETGVESVLTLSTDKAVNPTSTMGASKLLAERLTQAAVDRIGPDGPRLGCVRLGNVIGSAGSVVHLFEKQIRNGGPVTITEPNMTRFAMSKRQAAAFIVDCVLDQESGRIHAPKIGRLRVVDLAEAMISEYTPHDVRPSEIDIETIGRRPGERLHESLIGPTEVDRTVEHDGRYSIEPPSAIEDRSADAGSADLSSGGYRSDTGPFMSQDEIIDLLEDETDGRSEPMQNAESAAAFGNDD